MDRYLKGSPLVVPALSKRPPTGKTVAFVTCNVPDCQPDSMIKATNALGWKLRVFQYDVTKGPQDYTTQLQAAVTSKPDYLAVVCTYGEALAQPLINKAESEGIKVVTASATDANGVQGMVQGLPSYKVVGKLMGALAIADAGGKTSIAEAYDPSVGIVGAMVDAAQAEVKADGEGSTFQKFQVSLTRTPQVNNAAVISFLQRNPGVKYLLFEAPALTVGIFPALQAAGLLGKVKIITNYPNSTTVTDVLNGNVMATVAGETDYTWRLVDMFARLSVGDPISDKTPTGTARILQGKSATESRFNAPNYMNVYKKAWHVG